MSKRRARRDTEDLDDAVLLADMEDDPDFDAFLQAMERRNARRQSRERRKARRRIEATAEERWLKRQIDDWCDQGD